jgi:hypothetical protein
MIQFKDHWMNFDEIWYGHYAIAAHPTLIPFNFLQLIIPIWWTNKLVRLE